MRVKDIKNDELRKRVRCRICGRCVDLCPVEAISISVKNANYAKEALENIGGRVDYR
jgi:formate hydrogenlyase subunit 6/NADH:ubiquinone oxidoreductase subunit I